MKRFWKWFLADVVPPATSMTFKVVVARIVSVLIAALFTTGVVTQVAGGPSKPAQSATGSVAPQGWGQPSQTFHLPAPLLGAPLRVMYDSIEVGTVPSNPFAQAGYTSGSWPTYEPLRQAWPNAHTISIAVNASHHADCLDVEPGDASPSEAAAWVRSDIAAGFKKPCLYSSLSPWNTDLFPDLARAGIARSTYFAWDADYTFVAHLDAGFDATQYTDSCLGRNLDCSLVTLPFLTIAQPPYVAVPPGPPAKTVAHWRSARNTSFSVYHKHGCDAGLVHDKAHAHDSCFLLAKRVVYFQRELWVKVPHNDRFHCFGKLAHQAAPVCWITRPTASIWSKALKSTQHAYVVDSCPGIAGFGLPSNSKHCRTLRARINYYEEHLRTAYGLKPWVF